MMSKKDPRLASWINQKDSKYIKITIKKIKCFHSKAFSFLLQEDVFKIFNKKNQLIHLSFLMELTCLKANKHFNLSFSNKAKLFKIREMESLQKF